MDARSEFYKVDKSALIFEPKEYLFYAIQDVINDKSLAEAKRNRFIKIFGTDLFAFRKKTFLQLEEDIQSAVKEDIAFFNLKLSSFCFSKDNRLKIFTREREHFKFEVTLKHAERIVQSTPQLVSEMQTERDQKIKKIDAELDADITSISNAAFALLGKIFNSLIEAAAKNRYYSHNLKKQADLRFEKLITGLEDIVKFAIIKVRTECIYIKYNDNTKFSEKINKSTIIQDLKSFLHETVIAAIAEYTVLILKKYELHSDSNSKNIKDLLELAPNALKECASSLETRKALQADIDQLEEKAAFNKLKANVVNTECAFMRLVELENEIFTSKKLICFPNGRIAKLKDLIAGLDEASYHQQKAQFEQWVDVNEHLTVEIFNLAKILFTCQLSTLLELEVIHAELQNVECNILLYLENIRKNVTPVPGLKLFENLQSFCAVGVKSQPQIKLVDLQKFIWEFSDQLFLMQTHAVGLAKVVKFQQDVQQHIVEFKAFVAERKKLLDGLDDTRCQFETNYALSLPDLTLDLDPILQLDTTYMTNSVILIEITSVQAQFEQAKLTLKNNQETFNRIKKEKISPSTGIIFACNNEQFDMEFDAQSQTVISQSHTLHSIIQLKNKCEIQAEKLKKLQNELNAKIQEVNQLHEHRRKVILIQDFTYQGLSKTYQNIAIKFHAAAGDLQLTDLHKILTKCESCCAHLNNPELDLTQDQIYIIQKEFDVLAKQFSDVHKRFVSSLELQSQQVNSPTKFSPLAADITLRPMGDSDSNSPSPSPVYSLGHSHDHSYPSSHSPSPTVQNKIENQVQPSEPVKLEKISPSAMSVPPKPPARVFKTIEKKSDVGRKGGAYLGIFVGALAGAIIGCLFAPVSFGLSFGLGIGIGVGVGAVCGGIGGGCVGAGVGTILDEYFMSPTYLRVEQVVTISEAPKPTKPSNSEPKLLERKPRKSTDPIPMSKYSGSFVNSLGSTSSIPTMQKSPTSSPRPH